MSASPNSKSESRSLRSLLLLFTRTPLHVGSGSSVGPVDQPIQRERPTGFPIIPGSTLKGVFADDWMDPKTRPCQDPTGKEVTDDQGRPLLERYAERKPDGCWLFGAEDPTRAAAGALQFGEARVLAFPVRSAKGGFAWLTCPLIIQRAVRDGILGNPSPVSIPDSPPEEKAYFDPAGALAMNEPGKPAEHAQLVLEEYAFGYAGKLPAPLGEAFARLPVGDAVWKEVSSRLVVLSNGMMSHFTTTACEVAQHVRINDATGTADPGGLYSQENVPSETLFYTTVHSFEERVKTLPADSETPRVRTARDALEKFRERLGTMVQVGGDASTGLGYCTVNFIPPAS